MKKSYSEKLRDPRWQRKRLEVMDRDSFRCRRCGCGSKTLNVHHLIYRKGAEPWDYPSDHLRTLCEECHAHVENAEVRLALSSVAVSNIPPKVLQSLMLSLRFAAHHIDFSHFQFEFYGDIVDLASIMLMMASDFLRDEAVKARCSAHQDTNMSHENPNNQT